MKTICIELGNLRRIAADHPVGYLEDFLAAGDVKNNRLMLSKDAAARLRLKYSPPGLGDGIKRVFAPAINVLDLLFGTHLANCAGCNNRTAWLNEHFPNESK